MSCVAQFFQVWGSMISALALVATLCVITPYTFETRRLRKATVKQTELSLRPFVVVSVLEDNAGFSQRLVYKNIGHSPAIDVQTESFDAETFILNFEKYGLIEIGEKKDLNPQAQGKDTISEGLIRAVPTPSFTPKALNERNSNLKLILNIHYNNIEKVPYQTKVKINKKGIEIESTGKI
jgi:hypothetical protein